MVRLSSRSAQSRQSYGSPFSKFISKSLAIALILGLASPSIALPKAHAEPSSEGSDKAPGVSSGTDETAIVVVKADATNPQLLSFFEQIKMTFVEQIKKTYQKQGTAAVNELIQRAAKDEEFLPILRTIAQAKNPIKSAAIRVHRNEAQAIKYLNESLNKMGLGNLKLETAFDDSLPDPTQLKETPDLKPLKWLRYTAGPGVALAGALIQMATSHQTASDVGVFMFYTAGGALTSVLLEYQFAHPKINDLFWTKVWRLGGKIGGRISNILVNTLYGLAVYGGATLGAHAAGLLGMDPQALLSTKAALGAVAVSALIGGIRFHLAMGQYQTELSVETERLSISPKQRYLRETMGVIVNNGARVGGWIIPGDWSSYAMWVFFGLKTVPQFIKTNIQTSLAQRETARLILGEDHSQAPKKTFLERCALLLGKTGLIELPQLRR